MRFYHAQAGAKGDLGWESDGLRIEVEWGCCFSLLVPFLSACAFYHALAERKGEARKMGARITYPRPKHHMNSE